MSRVYLNTKLLPKTVHVKLEICYSRVFSGCLVSAIKYIISTLEIALKHNLYIS